MTQRNLPPAPLSIEDFEFDGTQVAKISIDPDRSGAVEWHAMERGSGEHIAFLERIVGQLQATPDEVKAQREVSQS